MPQLGTPPLSQLSTPRHSAWPCVFPWVQLPQGFSGNHFLAKPAELPAGLASALAGPQKDRCAGRGASPPPILTSPLIHLGNTVRPLLKCLWANPHPDPQALLPLRGDARTRLIILVRLQAFCSLNSYKIKLITMVLTLSAYCTSCAESFPCYLILCAESLEGLFSDCPYSPEEQSGSGRNVGTGPGHRASTGRSGDRSPDSSVSAQHSGHLQGPWGHQELWCSRALRDHYQRRP